MKTNPRLLLLAAAALPLSACVDPYYAGGYPPRPVVVPPPVYVAPRPVYVAPRPVYVAPRPVYVAPRPVYVAPRPVYPHDHQGGYGGYGAPRRW